MGGAPSLPTAATEGYGTMRGLVGCDCVIEFLGLAEQLGLARGLIVKELDLVQLTGDADASGGTHSKGGAFDVRQRSDDWVHIFREMGAAFWPRVGAAWKGNEHGHGVIGCVHNGPAAYQLTAYKRGYSGLGQGPGSSPYAGQWGYGSKDTEWRPSVIRSRTQGLAWARTTIEKESDVTTDADVQKIAQATADAVWAKVLTGHDEDGPGPLQAPKAQAVSWLVMARRDAGRVYWNTDTLERAAADTNAHLGALATDVAALSQLVQLGAGGPDVADIVAKVRDSLESLTFRLDAEDQAQEPQAVTE